MYFMYGEDTVHLYNVIINAFSSVHGGAPYQSVAAPVSNNGTDLVEVNNVAAPH